MHRNRYGLLGLPLCALVVIWALRGSGLAEGVGKLPPAPLGLRLVDWALPRSSDGQSWSLADDGRNAKAVVVLFLGTECPINNLYLPTLAALHKKYSPQRVLFVGINSNTQDDPDAIARHAKRFGLPFVVLKDAGAKVADRFAAQPIERGRTLLALAKAERRRRHWAAARTALDTAAGIFETAGACPWLCLGRTEHRRRREDYTSEQ